MNEESFKEILKAELNKFTTKEDLKKFATKDDLSNFATREDLNNFATKDDLNKFATKAYLEKRLKQSEEMLHLDMQIIAGKIIEEAKQNSAKDRNRVLDKMDQIIGELAQIREDQVFETYEHKEFKEQLADHENKLTKSEKN